MAGDSKLVHIFSASSLRLSSRHPTNSSCDPLRADALGITALLSAPFFLCACNQRSCRSQEFVCSLTVCVYAGVNVKGCITEGLHFPSLFLSSRFLPAACDVSGGISERVRFICSPISQAVAELEENLLRYRKKPGLSPLTDLHLKAYKRGCDPRSIFCPHLLFAL